MGKVKRILLWAYQLPQHLLAMLIFVYLNLFRGVKEDIEWKKSRLFIAKTKRLEWGVSLGFYVFLTPAFAGDIRTIQHEYGHTRQSMMLGPLYLLAVGVPSFVRASIWYVFRKLNRDYYKGYPEAWADRLGGVNR